MKSRTPITILADDLTGAAEIGAAVHARGLSTVVLTGGAPEAATADVVVHDTDSRLLQPADAARKIVAVASRARLAKVMRAGGLVLKKTDSVLRGPIAAELEALGAVTRSARVLLVPGNPRLGRIVREGRLYVNDVPIDRTPFAHDPHHPASTASVEALLGPHRFGSIHILAPGQPLPAAGLIIGQAASMEDLAGWAAAVPPETLIAGSSVFLEAVFEARGWVRNASIVEEPTGEPLLIISGTTATTTRDALASSPAAADRVHPMPTACAVSAAADSEAEFERWTTTLGRSLRDHGWAVAVPPILSSAEPAAAARIRSAFASAVAGLRSAGVFRHLVIEGGSTAATIIHVLRWHALDVAGELAPGVATLCPRPDPDYRVTLKPGSYPWPDGWWSQRTRHSPPASPHRQ